MAGPGQTDIHLSYKSSALVKNKLDFPKVKTS